MCLGLVYYLYCLSLYLCVLLIFMFIFSTFLFVCCLRFRFLCITYFCVCVYWLCICLCVLMCMCFMCTDCVYVWCTACVHVCVFWSCIFLVYCLCFFCVPIVYMFGVLLGLCLCVLIVYMFGALLVFMFVFNTFGYVRVYKYTLCLYMFIFSNEKEKSLDIWEKKLSNLGLDSPPTPSLRAHPTLRWFIPHLNLVKLGKLNENAMRLVR